MWSRRQFLASAAAAARLSAAGTMKSRDRVDRALRGQEVDRSPFTYWYHFGLEKEPPARHAQATLDFHRKFHTDVVKVMSDFPYPKPSGAWHQLKEDPNPFPAQIKALELIRDGLAGDAYFVETIFNPWNVATKLSSKEEVLKLKRENPQALLDAIQVIAKSEATHAHRAVAAGAAGIFLAIDNAQEGYLTPQEYAKFSEPFDRMVLNAVKSAPLNVLHLHGDKVYVDRFLQGWPAAAINYSTHGTGIGIADVRKKYSGVLMAGFDERKFRTLQPPELKSEWTEASRAAGKKFILAPGCSVPNDTKDDELLRVTKMLGA
jgi:uroporphyrinogen decarboxylase